MKVLITGIAILILLLQFNLFQLDFDRYLRAIDDLKFQAEDCAVAGTLCIVDDEFAVGNIVYDISQSEVIIYNLLMENMNLSTAMHANGDSYWLGTLDYTIWYYDDSGLCTKTHNGAVVSKQMFDYGNIFYDEISGYQYLISSPMVIVRLDIAGIKHRTNWITWHNIRRMASYEYGS